MGEEKNKISLLILQLTAKLLILYGIFAFTLYLLFFNPIIKRTDAMLIFPSFLVLSLFLTLISLAGSLLLIYSGILLNKNKGVKISLINVILTSIIFPYTSYGYIKIYLPEINGWLIALIYTFFTFLLIIGLIFSLKKLKLVR